MYIANNQMKPTLTEYIKHAAYLNWTLVMKQMEWTVVECLAVAVWPEGWGGGGGGGGGIVSPPPTHTHTAALKTGAPK